MSSVKTNVLRNDLDCYIFSYQELFEEEGTALAFAEFDSNAKIDGWYIHCKTLFEKASN